MSQSPSKLPPIGNFTWFVTRVVPFSLAAAALQIVYRAYKQPLTEKERLELTERRDPSGRARELQASFRRRRDAHIAEIEAEKAAKAERLVQAKLHRQEERETRPLAAESSQSRTTG